MEYLQRTQLRASTYTCTGHFIGAEQSKDAFCSEVEDLLPDESQKTENIPAKFSDKA